MRIVYEYSHLGGAEILAVRYPGIQKEVYDVIAQVKAERTKTSREKTMQGKRLIAPLAMNRQFAQLFHDRGYRQLRDTHTITSPTVIR